MASECGIYGVGPVSFAAAVAIAQPTGSQCRTLLMDLDWGLLWHIVCVPDRLIYLLQAQMLYPGDSTRSTGRLGSSGGVEKVEKVGSFEHLAHCQAHMHPKPV